MKKEKPVILLIANRQESFSREFLRGVVGERQYGCDWQLLQMPMTHERQHLEGCLDTLQVSGVIARGLSREILVLLNERDIPVVAIRGMEATSDDFANGPHVDDESIGEKAGKEFIRLSLNYWGFVHWEGVAWSEARRKSFHSYAASQNASNSTVMLLANERHGWDGVLKISKWLESLSKPCGILACNDEAGLDVLHACQLAGLSVPDQVAVIGVDNDRLLCESAEPPLSTIDLHAAEVGRASARQLRRMLGNGESDGEIISISQATVVVRESSHEIDRYLLIYQKALDCIRTKALSGISVAEVADACGVSRRGVERAFARQSGGSPAEVIRNQRLVGILSLLKSQSMSLDKLAEQTGFSDAAGLSNFVKRMTDKSPGEFR